MGLLAKLRRRAGGVSIEIPAAPEGFVPDLPEDDDALEDGATIADCVGSTFGIDYIDAKGQPSRRRITVRKIHAPPPSLRLGAHCHERDGYRMFRLDRIRSVIDLQTGEVVDDVRAYLGSIAMPEVDPADDTSELLDRERPAIQLLMFFARCDGQFHPSEKDVVLGFLAQRAGDLSPDWQRIERYLDTLHPDLGNFYDALDRFTDEDDEELGAIVGAVKRLVEADGVLSPEEAEFAVELENELHAAGRV